jgi:hypothetical protein
MVWSAYDINTVGFGASTQWNGETQHSIYSESKIYQEQFVNDFRQQEWDPNATTSTYSINVENEYANMYL